MKTERTILDTSDESAKRVTVTGWVSRHGRFYGDDERLARWDGATHVTCVCGRVHTKGWTLCDICRAVKDREKWESLPLIQWDGETPFCEPDGDNYWFNSEDFYTWCEDEGIKPSEVRLVLAVPRKFQEIDVENWIDDLPEDGELPDEIAEAVAQLNKAIRDYGKPASWLPGTERIIMEDLPRGQ